MNDIYNNCRYCRCFKCNNHNNCNMVSCDIHCFTNEDYYNDNKVDFCVDYESNYILNIIEAGMLINDKELITVGIDITDDFLSNDEYIRLFKDVYPEIPEDDTDDTMIERIDDYLNDFIYESRAELY